MSSPFELADKANTVPFSVRPNRPDTHRNCAQRAVAERLASYLLDFHGALVDHTTHNAGVEKLSIKPGSPVRSGPKAPAGVSGRFQHGIYGARKTGTGRELPDSSPKTGRSTSAARGFSSSLNQSPPGPATLDLGQQGGHAY